MKTSRRNFLKKGSVVALAAGVPIGMAEKALAAELARTVEEQQLGQKAFQAHLNSDFLIHSGGTKLKTQLVEVEDLRKRAQPKPNLGKEGFSLLFRGERKRALKQDTYTIEHEKLGTFSFLLVPTVTKDKDANYYSAVINRLYP